MPLRWSRQMARRLFSGTTAVCWLACGGLPPTELTIGAIEISTSTTGEDPDPDGYTLMLDGAETRAVGAAATATLADLAPGTHVIALTGVASNCQVQGNNPRGVTVAAGDTAAASFAVACTARSPFTGDLVVTTATSGAPPDPDGYTLTLNGDRGRPIGLEERISIPGLSPGDYAVELAGLAANCAVSGDNPRTATVPAGGAAETSFAVECQPTNGALRVTISGLPSGTDAEVTVTGPNGYEEGLVATSILEGLVPGEYTVSAAGLVSGGFSYTPTPDQSTVSVSAGATAAVTITYGGEPLPTLNLRIAALYLVQTVQTLDNEVPLVAGRDAYLRVFALANEANSVTPSVRVRVYEGATLLDVLTIAAPGGSTPTAVDEGTLGSSWNVVVPGSLIRAGLRVLADADPAGAIAEADETDNRFPVTGGPRTVEVRTAPPLALTLVPVRQSANDLQGDVTTGNRDSYLHLARRMYPIPGYDADVHPVYTTAGPLQPSDANGAWGTLLSEIDALRIAEGTGRQYYGVVRLDYSGGQVARSATGTPAAVGFDNAAQRARMAAHELGHMWGRDHAPCGNAQALDPDYPYPDGRIGKYGFDVANLVLQEPSTPDVMGLCQNVWISDYTYRGVMDYRGAALGVAGTTAGARPALLVWGHIADGRAVLEPAFQVVTRPVLPDRPGPFSIEGLGIDGAPAFRLSFEATAAADDPRGTLHFAFAVPLDRATAGRLQSVRLSGPGVGTTAVSRPSASLRATPAVEPASLSHSAGGTMLRWDAAAHPAVMVRDARTGAVLAFGRGGSVTLPAGTGEVELVLSDGVRSRHARVGPAGP